MELFVHQFAPPRFASPHALTSMLALANDSSDSDKHSHKSVSSACRWNKG